MNEDDHVLDAVLLSIGLGYVLPPSGGFATFRTVAAVIYVVPDLLPSEAVDVFS